jgi:hypothetical protein
VEGGASVTMTWFRGLPEVTENGRDCLVIILSAELCLGQVEHEYGFLVFWRFNELDRFSIRDTRGGTR